MPRVLDSDQTPFPPVGKTEHSQEALPSVVSEQMEAKAFWFACFDTAGAECAYHRDSLMHRVLVMSLQFR